ncbi:MAG: hypothetical protein GY906_18070 [bacterium]|nr:hypothetical protein [bacterium]
MGWTDIDDTTFDAESPNVEGLFEDIVENTEYNFEHAVRGGTHAAGVRLATARGAVSFTAVSQTLLQVDITLNGGGTDCDDGDPNFDAAPRVILTIREDPTSANDFTSGGASSFNEMHYWIEEGYPTTATCRCQVWMDDGSAGPNYKGMIHFIAVGTVTSGE